VSFSLVVARGTRVRRIHAESVHPAIVHADAANVHDLGGCHCGRVGLVIGERRYCGLVGCAGNGGVGAVVARLLGGELAEALMVGPNEVGLEVGERMLCLWAFAPRFDATTEDTSVFEDLEEQANRSAVTDWLTRIRGKAAGFLEACPDIFNGVIRIPLGSKAFVVLFDL